MGLFGKIKNIFYDIEEVEVPEAKEEKQKEEIKEKHEEPNTNVNIKPIKEEDISERELFKSKSTFNFPIFDSEEEDIKGASETQKEVYEREPIRREVRKENNFSNMVNTINEPKEKKIFTPTPVISPVYGILDKNYVREETTVKREEPRINKTNNNDYDSVRRKAYGTLEDELENTLTRLETKDSTVKELTQDLTKTIEQISQSSRNIEDLLTEIESTKVTVGDLEEKEKDKIEKNEPIDNTLEHDLFNLIDSMYDDKEE